MCWNTILFVHLRQPSCDLRLAPLNACSAFNYFLPPTTGKAADPACASDYSLILFSPTKITLKHTKNFAAKPVYRFSWKPLKGTKNILALKCRGRARTRPKQDIIFYGKAKYRSNAFCEREILERQYRARFVVPAVKKCQKHRQQLLALWRTTSCCPIHKDSQRYCPGILTSMTPLKL